MSETSYSPRLRTGVVLCGTGTAGAYQAGALRAMLEAGIKIDVLAAHGAGVLTALATAVDGGAKVWDPAGVWADPRLRQAYRWRTALRVGMAGLVGAAALLLSPLILLVVAAVAYAAGVLASLVGLTALSARLIGAYGWFVESLFDPPILPTVMPRLIVLVLLLVWGTLVAAAIAAARQERSRRRRRGAFWWRLLGYPLDATEPVNTCVETLWRLVRGASHEPRPAASEIGRRYVDVLADNFGQPGFHEVLVAVHDLDGRRDLVGAVLAAPARTAFESRRPGPDRRDLGIVDFTGPQRELLVDFLTGALRLPVATAPTVVRFPADSVWRGEPHRICDRPELASRLVEELAAIGVEQVVLISPTPPPALPHGMRTRPIDVRGRVGELLRSVETAALHDAWVAAAARFSAVFIVRPGHNPVGPFDFGGAFDEASDRHRTIGELMEQGHADAYRHFIDPVVATGEPAEVGW